LRNPTFPSFHSLLNKQQAAESLEISTPMTPNGSQLPPISSQKGRQPASTHRKKWRGQLANRQQHRPFYKGMTSLLTTAMEILAGVKCIVYPREHSTPKSLLLQLTSCQNQRCFCSTKQISTTTHHVRPEQVSGNGLREWMGLE